MSQSETQSVTFADIEAARERIREAIYVSPCAYTKTLSEAADCRLFLKLENLQMTGSFKERGACNKLALLTEAERSRGVVAASAGNHAQGVAYHAKRLDIAATIVMPTTTPLVKVTATRAYGANVVLEGANYDEAYAHAREIEAETNAAFVHPFDDPAVIAGQGTIGLELLEQNPYLEAIVVAIGGGGLAAGVAVAIKETNPRIKVYGVEPASLPSMRAAVDAGHPVEVPPGSTLADGIAVRKAGALTHPLVAKYVDDIVSVDEEDIAAGILTLLEQEKTVAEGAGAAPLAAILKGSLPIEGKRVAAIICGGNIDVNMISRIIDRGLVQSGRLYRVRVRMPDVPGRLSALLTCVATRGANVLQIRHDRVGETLAIGEAVVILDLETRGFAHIESLEQAMAESGFIADRPTPTS